MPISIHTNVAFRGFRKHANHDTVHVLQLYLHQMQIDYNFCITLPDAQISVFITLFVPMKTLSNDILSSNYYVTGDTGCTVLRS